MRLLMFQVSVSCSSIFNRSLCGAGDVSGLRLSGFFPFDPQVRIEPLQLALEEIDLMVRFLNAVALAGVAEKNRFDAALLQRAIILFGLRDGHSQVALAVRDQERRFDAVDVSHRRPFAVSFGGTPRLAAEAVFHQPGYVALAVETVPIADAGMADGGFEPVGLRDRPEGHEPAIAPAHPDQLVGIGDAPRYHRIDAGHNVLEIFSAPIADVRGGEVNAVAGRTARVGHQHDVSVPGPEL